MLPVQSGMELAYTSFDIAGSSVDNHNESRDRLGGSLPACGNGFGVSFPHPLFSTTSTGRERFEVDFVTPDIEPSEIAAGEPLMTVILREDDGRGRLSRSPIRAGD